MKITKYLHGPTKFKPTKLSMPKRNTLVNLSRFQNLDRVLRRFTWKLLSIVHQKRIQGFSQVNLYYNFGRYIYVMKQRHGVLYVVKYLKACSLALQRAVAGSPMSSLRDIEPDLPLPRLSSSGLPVIIGTRDRRAILAGSRKVISKYLTLFGLYRIIDAPVKAKLNTITDEFSGVPSFLQGMGHWFRMNSKQLLQPYNKEWDIKVRGIKIINKSSPSNSVSWFGLTLDLFPLFEGPMFSVLSRYCNATGSMFFFQDMAQWYNDARAFSKGDINSKRKEGVLQYLFPRKKSLTFTHSKDVPIGQLAFKKEAAGKLRVFAMVDP